MNIQENLILLLVFSYSLSSLILGIKNRRNPYGLVPQYILIGAFVWVDAIVFGLFFALASLISFALKDFTLFLIVYFLFWAIRSFGEQVYWFLEQFASSHRNNPQTLWPAKYFKGLFRGEESWIVIQIVMLCVSVVSIISTVYLFSIWL